MGCRGRLMCCVEARSGALGSCVEIGWPLGANYWYRGLATEGARAVAEHAFQILGQPESSPIRPNSAHLAARHGEDRNDMRQGRRCLLRKAGHEPAAESLENSVLALRLNNRAGSEAAAGTRTIRDTTAATREGSGLP